MTSAPRLRKQFPKNGKLPRGCGSSSADTLHLVFDNGEPIGAEIVLCRFLANDGSENFSYLFIRSAIS
jgi:hypothetical protein